MICANCDILSIIKVMMEVTEPDGC